MERKNRTNLLEDVISRTQRSQEVYDLIRFQGIKIQEVVKKTGCSKATIYRILRTFEAETPQIVEQMKKRSEKILPEDYKALREELLKVKSELKKATLRADFYEEMVQFGKEVYGVDLKKAGTK